MPAVVTENQVAIVASTPAEQNGGSNDPPKEMKLYHMNPFPRAMFLRRFTVTELMRVAHISAQYFNWVRGYMFESKVLNIKPCNNKICLSSSPCRYTNYSCSHRILRSISGIETLYNAGLLRVETICIQAPSKPSKTKCAINMVKKITAIFKRGVRNVIIDVNKEKPYVGIVKRLLVNNDNTIEKIMIRNSDVDNSKFNFPHFLNRTSWFVENFPVRKGHLKRKKQLNQRKRQADNQYLRNNRLA